MEEYTNYLVHHGVKGMRWGVRRYQNADGTLTAAGRAKLGYKEAKKAYKKDVKSMPKIAFGAKGLQSYQSARNKVDKSRLNMYDAKAKLKKTKKGKDADINFYAKRMKKTGLPGSVSDDMYRGESTRLYNHLKKKKGKAYADKVLKNADRRAKRDLVIAGAAFVASAAGSVYLASKGY